MAKSSHRNFQQYVRGFHTFELNAKIFSFMLESEETQIRGAEENSMKHKSLKITLTSSEVKHLNKNFCKHHHKHAHTMNQ